MKLVNFKKDQQSFLGVKTDQGILNLKKAGQTFQVEVPDRIIDFIKKKDLAGIKQLAERAHHTEPSMFENEDDLEFLPSVINPEKIICVGLNYVSHVEEAKIQDIPKTPILFSKYGNALAAHNEVIPLPKNAEKIDYEAELVVVIGKEAKNVSEEEALSYVFGYSTGNDLSARDLQFTTSQWLLGKSLDGFAPVGPYLVTADEVNPTHLHIETKVNGEVRQSSNTQYMIFNCAAIISYISKHMTLKPGDLIFTGTPEGVILGYPEEKQQWLKSGDVVEVTIEGIGKLRNVLEKEAVPKV
ncbi:2-keto-4-pentenoate hydratase/2-oxohepta-3-ene-1,7-dioic acid hydratase in catechol pathway [Bacillus oleivorans]|uniref:2-keto-4-pentenoate hydratase/2-oxohepta-3-ene-1,7-dioic acid hydratase in catechol pathway n=1 Tax=Bacillus oleivorans TaxID=1448271 RepID=A0A285CUQ1_9BACI|nr:fumarylacetoacetate hydrolase family protein [Bacillus oleivorans]SNX70766.1 2-keto-4-pentenoate hydratase/2-oxohepta-3-ene-1,7-dioic acid hydratase in catechol pathway [Bacillus oleivorans]